MEAAELDGRLCEILLKTTRSIGRPIDSRPSLRRFDVRWVDSVGVWWVLFSQARSIFWEGLPGSTGLVSSLNLGSLKPLCFQRCVDLGGFASPLNSVNDANRMAICGGLKKNLRAHYA